MNTSVDDAIIDVESGAIQYVVISVSSAAMGERLIPIPLKIFSWDSANKTFTLTTDVQTIENASSFKVGEYPDTQTPDWDAEIRSYWENLTGKQ